MSLKSRLLAMAFAAADALVEIGKDGQISFALGAGPAPGIASGDWIGTPFADLMAPASGVAIAEALAGLAAGGRIGPIDLLMTCGDSLVRKATFRAFMLPELAPNVSCAITYAGIPFALADSIGSADILGPESFLKHARQSLTASSGAALQRLALAFIEVQGLTATNEAANDRVATRLGSRLRAGSHDGQSAGRLTSTRFAVVKNAADVHDFEAEVRDAGQAEGLTLTARTSETPIGSDALCALRAMRFAIEGCLKDDASQPDLSFAESLAKTLKDADRFRGIVRDREFALFYQPVVDLKTRAVQHFEALARFGQSDGPAPAIRLAEELALIEDFDLAVAEKIVKRLRQPGSSLLKVAINVSGASLATNAYVAALLRMTASEPQTRRRLLVEITETAALADIPAANRRLGALRDAGIKVCIDDFGAGSAAFDYLRGLSVDAVKIDGSLVTGIHSDARARTVVGHLVEMCGSLKLGMIAEMVETEDAAGALQELGVGYAQGWLFGRPEAEPVFASAPAPTARARRQGMVDAWG